MKINAPKLKKLVKQKRATLEQLAAALPKPSTRRKQDEIALKKVKNWLVGRNHPAAKSAEIAAIAGVLQVEPKDILRFTGMHRFARSSPRKARLVADLIRGKRVDEAQALLQFSPKRAGVMVSKTLKSAIAQAEAADAQYDRLFVAETKVDDSFQIKRFQPKDRGRAHPIIKRTTHITIGVEER